MRLQHFEVRQCNMDPVRASPCRRAAIINTPHQQAGHTKALDPTLRIGQGKISCRRGCPHTKALTIYWIVFATSRRSVLRGSLSLLEGKSLFDNNPFVIRQIALKSILGACILILGGFTSAYVRCHCQAVHSTSSRDCQNLDQVLSVKRLKNEH